MRKISIILFTVFLNLGFYSCTPEVISADASTLACCDEEEEILPPPPPPPPPPIGG